MQIKDWTSIKTLGELKKSGYTSKSVKEELRDNLVARLQNKERVFSGIHGYEHTVIPEFERAILSRHNVLFLGLRGQAKTRLARMMTDLLDEYVPVVQGSAINDDPLAPISTYAQSLIEEQGDKTPIMWLHRSDRYTEKLATPDVSVADLIGDIDPIKAVNLKLSYSDERVLHYGLVPRSNRCIFVINELPDLQARIQVALFNILQEGDIQIRGFKLQLPLDVQFVFTANPEDYTNRGSIVTPLKDRIESQILTHYPKSIETSKAITLQEANLSKNQREHISIPEISLNLLEQIAFEARNSEYVDQNSGVSARLTISGLENLFSTAERRMIINGEESTQIRVSDLWGVIPAITGKIELVYEGEQEGTGIVAQNIIGRAIRTQFAEYFPNPETFKRKSKDNPYPAVTTWFGKGNSIDLLHDLPQSDYETTLNEVEGLGELVTFFYPEITAGERYFLMEFVLFAMAEYSLISKGTLASGYEFKDLLSGMFSGSESMEDLDDEEDFV